MMITPTPSKKSNNKYKTKKFPTKEYAPIAEMMNLQFESCCGVDNWWWWLRRCCFDQLRTDIKSIDGRFRRDFLI